MPGRTETPMFRESIVTANVYTDPKLLDVAGAVASLPDLPLGLHGAFGKGATARAAAGSLSNA